MGMFDTVIIDCPYCEETIERQTKSGPCILGRYGFGNAPLSVLEGVLGLTFCEHCEKQFMVELINEPIAVQRKLTESEERELRELNKIKGMCEDMTIDAIREGLK